MRTLWALTHSTHATHGLTSSTGYICSSTKCHLIQLCNTFVTLVFIDTSIHISDSKFSVVTTLLVSVDVGKRKPYTKMWMCDPLGIGELHELGTGRLRGNNIRIRLLTTARSIPTTAPGQRLKDDQEARWRRNWVTAWWTWWLRHQPSWSYLSQWSGFTVDFVVIVYSMSAKCSFAAYPRSFATTSMALLCLSSSAYHCHWPPTTVRPPSTRPSSIYAHAARYTFATVCKLGSVSLF